MLPDCSLHHIFGIPVRPCLVMFPARALFMLAMALRRRDEGRCARSAGGAECGTLASTRPGSLAVTSWKSHPLPSGSVNGGEGAIAGTQRRVGAVEPPVCVLVVKHSAFIMEDIAHFNAVRRQGRMGRSRYPRR